MLDAENASNKLNTTSESRKH